MAKIVFGMSQSLDGYVDGPAGDLDFPAPGPELFRYFTEWVASLSGSIYGRRIYEVMRYWDDDRSDWSDAEREFAVAWRRQPKWVVSRSLKPAGPDSLGPDSLGPNATLISEDLEAVVRGLRARLDGEIEVAGPEMARSLTDLGLVDEYRLHIRPFVLGGGKPFFAGPRPPLRFVASDRVAEDVVRLTYVPL